MWETLLNLIPTLLGALSKLGISVIEFLENESLNVFLNSLVVGPNVSTYEVLFGSAISAVLIVGVYNWITNVVIPN